MLLENAITDKEHVPVVIEVDGIIGVGKTTFIEEFLVPELVKRGFRVKVIKEPVDQWGELLPLFYNDPKRYSYLFQTMAFHDRVCISQEMWEKYKNEVDIFISERGLISDPLFMKTLHNFGNVSDIEMDCYNKWWNMWRKLVSYEPQMYIFITAQFSEIMERIKRRSREGESKVSEEYQLKLQYNHNTLFDHNLAHLTRSIDVTNDYRNNQKLKDDMMYSILVKLLELCPKTLQRNLIISKEINYILSLNISKDRISKLKRFDDLITKIPNTELVKI